jgi:regulator of replication initiation timing
MLSKRDRHRDTREDAEVVTLREACWRQSNELAAQRATIEVLRSGANALAVENAMLKIENDHLRRSAVRRASPHRH